MYAQSVTIGSEFFVKSFNDYRDKYWAFAREIMQNSIDCGSTAIDIKIIEVPDDDCTLVVVRNDGEPMTREILVGKLLSLGSSGKDFQGAVGGFGKAKEILYFAHRSYAIASGLCRVSGSGAATTWRRDFLPGDAQRGRLGRARGRLVCGHNSDVSSSSASAGAVCSCSTGSGCDRRSPGSTSSGRWSTTARMGATRCRQVRGEPAPGEDRRHPDVRRKDRLQEDDSCWNCRGPAASG